MFAAQSKNVRGGEVELQKQTEANKHGQQSNSQQIKSA
jgi:hypothetical protein